jgi:hypothetical protein
MNFVSLGICRYLPIPTGLPTIVGICVALGPKPYSKVRSQCISQTAILLLAHGSTTATSHQITKEGRPQRDQFAGALPM